MHYLPWRAGSRVVETAGVPLPDGLFALTMTTDRMWYRFGVAVSSQSGLETRETGRREARYLSTEAAGGLTGVYLKRYPSSRGGPAGGAADFDWFDYRPAP